jgi:hypothetical protein
MRTKKNELALIALIYFIILIMIVSKLKVIEPWDQVELLWRSEVNPVLILGHPHMPRYLLVYPGFLLEGALPGLGFSLYMASFFIANFVLFRMISLRLSGRSPYWYLYCIFFAAHIAMNGRGAIAWCGWLICLWVCMRLSSKLVKLSGVLVWIAISCLFATVSTGVFVIVVCTYVYYIGSHVCRNLKSSGSSLLIYLFILIIFGTLIVDFFVLSISKNIDFYGGGIEGFFNMFDHGLGVVFTQLSLIGVFLLYVSSCLMLMFAYLVAMGKKFTDMEVIVLVPIFGGIFGYTVLTLFIPPIIFVIQSIAVKRKKYKGSGIRLQNFSPCLAR